MNLSNNKAVSYRKRCNAHRPYWVLDALMTATSRSESGKWQCFLRCRVHILRRTYLQRRFWSAQPEHSSGLCLRGRGRASALCKAIFLNRHYTKGDCVVDQAPTSALLPLVLEIVFDNLMDMKQSAFPYGTNPNSPVLLARFSNGPGKIPSRNVPSAVNQRVAFSHRSERT